MLHECYMIVTFRFCHRSQSKSLKLPVFKGFPTDLWLYRFIHISFYPLYMGFIYDNKSRLLSYDCGYDYSADISWENNCISEVTSFGKIVYSGNTCKGYNPYIVYNASSTPFYELAIAQPRLFGLHTNQLPKEIKGQAANGGDHNIDISYELDKDGYLIKLTATHHSSDFWDDGKIETYEYTWQ